MKRVAIVAIASLALVALGGFLFYFCNGFFYQCEGYVSWVGVSDWDATYRFHSGQQITYSHDDAGIMTRFLDDHYGQGYYLGAYILHDWPHGKPVYFWWHDFRYGLSDDGPRIRIVVEKKKYQIGNTLVSFNITEEDVVTPRMWH